MSIASMLHAGCVGILLATTVAADDASLIAAARAAVARGDAAALLALTRDRYVAMRSFEATGELTYRSEASQWLPVPGRRFSLVLSRDGRYVVTWRPARAVASAPPAGAVWNQGDGAHGYFSVTTTYRRYRWDDSAFAVAAGVSEGLTRGIPPLVMRGRGWFTEIEDPVITGTETVDDEPCWVVKGRSKQTRERMIWISTERLVIRRHRWSNEPPEGYEPPETSLQARTGLLAGLDDEERKKMEFILDMQAAMAKYGGLFHADKTETYRDIRVDEPVEDDHLTFTLPEGATLERTRLSPPDDPAGERVAP